MVAYFVCFKLFINDNIKINMDYNQKYKLAANLIQKGYIVHCTDADFKYFSPSHIKGGSRAKEGYGVYFSDMPYKPIEYGDIFKVVKKSDFNFINSQDPITKYSYIFNNDILTDIYRLEQKLDTIRNVREYDELNAEISRLRNEYKQLGGDELFRCIDMAINQYKAKTIGGLEYNLPNPDVMIPKLTQLYIKYGYDGYETDGIYTIFNFNKLNHLVETVNTSNPELPLVENVITEGVSPIVYHFTDINSLYRILLSGKFFLKTGAFTHVSDLGGGKRMFYLSTTRVKNAMEGYSYRFIGRGGVRITLDGNKLNQKYYGSSFNYWGDGEIGRMKYLNPEKVGFSKQWNDSMRRHREDETEDRVWSYKSTIPEALNYILRIDIYIKNIELDSSLKQTLYNVYQDFHKRINICLYEDEKSFALGDKNTVTPEWLGKYDMYKDYEETFNNHSIITNARTEAQDLNILASALALMTYYEPYKERQHKVIEYCKKYGFKDKISKNLLNKISQSYGSDLNQLAKNLHDGSYHGNKEVENKIKDMVTHWMRKKGVFSIRDLIKQNMNESLDLSSFEVKDKLNPDFWKDEILDSRARLKLLDIADDFTDFLNVDWVEPEDITMTGSLANYNWSEEFSDIDLHIIIDYKKVDKRTDFVAEYFKSKKELWNQNHQDIKIYGYPVELYVQDKTEPHASTGVYSLETNKWLVKPQRKEPTKSNLNAAEKDAETWVDKIDSLLNRYYPDLTDSQKEKVLDDLDKTFNTIKQNRRNGFEDGGDEMNKDNLTFKILRRNGYLDKVWDKKNEIYDDLMSINEGIGNSDTLIIYHRVDWDGYTSGAVALKAMPNADTLGWNYGDPLPDVSTYKTVILVDLTISDKNDYTWMYENADKLIWIDHHSNAISKITNTNIRGVRQDGIGACVLTWNYFFAGQELPPHIALIGTYDVFRKDGKFAKWSDAWSYQLALNQYGPATTKKDADKRVKLALRYINEPPQITLKRIKMGEGLEEKRSQQEVETFNNAQFVKHNGITICKLIADGQPAMLIKTNSDNHTADLFVIRSVEPLQSDQTKYKISLRVPENSKVDASKIARQFGGNGHEKAAGCLMTAEEFENL